MGGVLLGSKQALSNGNEPEELTDLIVGFEAMNQCKVTLNVCVELKKGYLDTLWTATALSTKDWEQVPKPLELANVSVWAGDFKTLMGLVTRLLYSLDFMIASHEFDNVATKKA
jgi:hypothetical protein